MTENAPAAEEVRVEPTWSPTHFDPWPSTIWLGRTAHQWPIAAFVDRGHAEYWASHGPASDRRFIAQVDLPPIRQELEVKVQEATVIEPRMVPQRKAN